MLSVLGEAGGHMTNHVIIKKLFYWKDVQITFLDKVNVGDNLKEKTIMYWRFYKSSKDQWLFSSPRSKVVCK